MVYMNARRRRAFFSEVCLEAVNELYINAHAEGVRYVFFFFFTNISFIIF